jgi:putative flavoprotein involved in K+ transport
VRRDASDETNSERTTMHEATIEHRNVQTLEISDAERVRQWLAEFEDALRAGDRAELEALFVENSHWRDLFAFTWNLTPSNSRAAIVARLLEEQPRVQARAFKIAEGRKPPRRVKRTGVEVIEAIFQFQTAVSRCAGVLRLPTGEPNKAWVMSTSLRELKGHEEPVDGKRPDGASARIFGGEAWGQRRAREQRYEDREPAVLIVGGGQNGIVLSARLRMLGVDSLIVERLPNVGDVWRKRYSALALHNEIVLNHMPYMPFPASWPKYLPKDMLGNWLEAYANAMECNVWTSTSFVEGRYDEKRGEWRARVRRADGSERVLRPRHLVFANGVVGEPKLPDTPGLNEFKGHLMHAQGFDSGAPWRGKNVIVLGVGNSAHDIAQDLHGHGANVKMIQRGSITVFSVKAASLNHAIYYNEGLSQDDADLIASCNTFPVLLRGYQLGTQRMLEIDKQLLADLHRIGFKLDIGPEGGGHQMHVRKNHGGYYLNVGCSDLLVSGEIDLLHFEDIERFVANGVLMKDGRVEKADVVVAATGYRAPTEVVRQLLGEEIAEKIGPVWGLDDGGEMCNMYKPTPQKGLWFTGGGFAQTRVWSHYVALQIKAREAGIVADTSVKRPTLDTLTGPPRPYHEAVPPRDDAGIGAGTDGF